ncbi:TonB-dependent receptor [Pedobacter sp. P351]|uniref:TonB-dependent receptor n=1 Tax=Pedobacter superstes TaxID=3133441 RepID=UPI0030B1089F
MKKRLVTLVLLLLSVFTFAQTREIKGLVQDSSALSVISATVKLTSSKDTLISITDIEGKFSFRSVKSPEFSLTITNLGFMPYTKVYSFSAATPAINLPVIIMAANPNQLSEVVISGVAPVTVKEDTLQFNAAAYPVSEGSAVEEVLKKLPGIVVDKDGNVEAEGKKVARIRINGKDFFGGDVQTATQNLPADIIKNIQIIDDYGDEANLTGVKTGDPEKIINITILPGKNKGSYGNAGLAGGNIERYSGNFNLTNFLEERRFAVQALANNLNRNGFNFDGGGRGGGARGANFGGGLTNGNGFTNSLSAGIDYQNIYGKKINYGGSYSYAGTSNNALSNSFTQSFNSNDTTLNKRDNNSTSKNLNQRFTGNFEYRVNKGNYIKISPYFSYNNSENTSAGVSRLSRSKYYTFNNNTSANNSLAPNYGTDLIYSYKFKKRGRNLTLNTSLNFSGREQNRDSYNIYDRIDSNKTPVSITNTIQDQFNGSDNQNMRTNIKAAYNEPIGKTSFLEFSYAWNKSDSRSVRDVVDTNPVTGEEVYNSLQSNDFKYQFTTNRIGLSFRGRKPKYNYTVGVVAQPSLLTGQNIGKNVHTTKENFNIIPTVRFAYNFSKTHSLTLNYNGSSFEPGFQQLQPLRDSSNLNNIIVGNPELNAEVTHRLSFNYRKSDSNTQAGKLFVANISFDQVYDKIVSSLYNAKTGTARTTTYQNTDGFFGVNGNISYTHPFARRKYTVTVASVGNYNNSASFTDDFRNEGNNWTIMPRASFRMDIKDIVDVNLAADYRLRKSKIVFENRTNQSESKTLNLSMGGRNFFFKKYTLGYDFTKQLNYGYQSISNNPNLLNVYFERRLLKQNMGTLRLQGYDLFNQNVGISRVVNANNITDSQSNRLARYFLVSFNLQVRKFTKGSKMPPSE